MGDLLRVRNLINLETKSLLNVTLPVSTIFLCFCHGSEPNLANNKTYARLSKSSRYEWIFHCIALIDAYVKVPLKYTDSPY